MAARQSGFPPDFPRAFGRVYSSHNLAPITIQEDEGLSIVGGKLDLEFVEEELQTSLGHVRDTAQRLARPTMEDANLTLVTYFPSDGVTTFFTRTRLQMSSSVKKPELVHLQPHC